MNLLINLDPASSAPLQQQLYDEFRRLILTGGLTPGQRVPSTRELSKSLGVSRTTVTASYDYLLSEGYLESATGSGTYVSRKLPDELLRASMAEAAVLESQPEIPVDKIGNRKILERLSWYGSSLETRGWMVFSGQESEYEFSFGRPDFDHFPMREWLQLISQHARKKRLSVLDYPGRSQGYLPLREALSEYLGRSRALQASADQIIVVNGSQQAIDLVTRVLIDRGDAAAIEEPGYLGAQRALIAQGAGIVPVPVDHHGLRVEELKRKAAESERPVKLVYVTPSHQFPTGVVLSLPRRLELLSWAARTKTFIVEDDYDSEFRYKGRPIPALAGLDQNGSVIYIGTFSKVLMPSLRLGYLVVPPDMVRVFARAKWVADRHSPLLEQQALTDFIRQGHLERHIRKMRSLYEKKRQLVLETIGELFGSNAQVLGDNAGINVLVRFNTALEDPEIEKRARQRGIGVTSTRHEYLTTARQGEFLLNYGGMTESQLRYALGVLAEIVLEIGEPKSGTP
jgi:GntR family transcriptional regulator/MocR family aminotransferase